MTQDTHLYRLFRKPKDDLEYCFNIQSDRPLTNEEVDFLLHLLGAGHDLRSVKLASELNGDKIVEIGPRLAFATPYSTHLTQICRDCGVACITRLE